jgi:hypothetical protein
VQFVGTTPPRCVVRAFVSRENRRKLLVFGVLAICTVVISRGIHKGEFNFNTDETIHASTGLYFADFMRDLPLRHPVQYTFRYYGQYPALGIVHWPPVFHITEGLAFFLFGSSVVVARITVLLFALLGIYFQFRLVEYVENTRAAVIASILFATLPLVLLFEKVVMLEVPALSLSIAAFYYWFRFLRTEAKRDIYWFAFFACAALLTKQTVAFLIPVCVLALVLTRRVHLLWRKITWQVAAICALMLTPYYVAMTRVHGTALAKSVEAAHPISLLARVTFYWRALPHQLTWPVMALAVLGITTYCARQEWEKLALCLAWILGCYITLTPIGYMEARFMIYWLPAWAWLAAVPFTVLPEAKFFRVLQPAAAVLLVTAQLLSTWSFQRPYVAGYGAAARSLVTMAKSGYVLFDGPLPGNFVFFVRAADPSRRIGILRKALYVTMISKGEGSEELVHDSEGIRNVLAEDGVRFIIVAENTATAFPVQRTLRDLLQNDHQFCLRAIFPVTSNDLSRPGTFLAIYENLQAPTLPASSSLHLKMLTTRQDLTVPFATLGPPRYSWTAFGK